MSLVCCGVCGDRVPKDFADEHHITPRQVGKHVDNSSSNLVWLCSGCHQNLHTLSYKIIYGKTSIARDLADMYYDNSGAVARIMEYATHVAREIIAAREGERDLPEKVMVAFELPREIYTLLRIMSVERRGHRQFTPMLVEHLTGLAREYEGGASDRKRPEMTHTDIA